MTRIHLNRDRQNLGQFSPEEVAAGLRDGRFLPTDLAWREGMETWQPLSTFTDLPSAPAGAAEPAPTLAPGSPVEQVAASAPISPAWEREGSTGWFTRLTETIKEVLLSPQTAFAGMPPTGGYKKPLTFVLIGGSAGFIAYTLYSILINTLPAFTSGGLTTSEGVTATPAQLTIVMAVLAVLTVFLTPVLIAIGSFLGAAIYHVALMLVGAAPKSFEVTYRVVAYVTGATYPFLMIPFCGGLIQFGWSLYSMTIGFREAHGTTTAKALIAVLLPLLLCCGLIAALIAAGIALPAMSQLPR